MIFEGVKIEDIDLHWKKCREILEKAFRGKVHADCADDYYPNLLTGHLQLWIARNENEIIGSAITIMEHGSRAKICTILSCAGDDLANWIDLLDVEITGFAKQNNCDAIEYIGRKGFTKFIPKYVEDGRIYVKLLKGE